MSQTNMWGKGVPPPEVSGPPVVVNLPGKVGPRAFGIHHAIFENHAEGSRADMVWLELRTKPDYVVDERGDIRRLKGGEAAPKQSEYVLLVRIPALVLYQLYREAAKYG